MAFRRDGSGLFACSLLTTRPAKGTPVRVGPYPGTLTRTAAGAELAVRLGDTTLLVEVAAAYPISDGDLIRFAAGVHPTDRAQPRT
jgi:hypothetical protein